MGFQWEDILIQENAKKWWNTIDVVEKEVVIEEHLEISSYVLDNISDSQIAKIYLREIKLKP